MCGCELLTQFFLTPLKVVTTPLNPTQHPLRTLERFESLNLTYNGGGVALKRNRGKICTACYVHSFKDKLMKISGIALGTVKYPLKLVSTRFCVMDIPIDVDEDNQ